MQPMHIFQQKCSKRVSNYLSIVQELKATTGKPEKETHY